MATSIYIPFGLTLSQGQKEILAKAVRDGAEVTLRLSVDQLHGEEKLGLTKRQIAHIMKKKGEGAGADIRFSKKQLKKITKMGGILPLIPLILGGLSAAGALAGGAAGITKAVQDKQANDAANAEAARHNREVEAQLGSGLYLGKRGGCCPMCRGSGLFLGSKN